MSDFIAADAPRNKPDLFSYIARHVVAPAWAVYEHTPYLKHLKKLQVSPYRPLDDVRQEQWQRLQTMLHHAADHVPYYRDLWRERGIEISSVRTWEDFYRLPVLEKDHIRRHGRRMLADNVPAEKLVWTKTSGSTGVSLEIAKDEASQQWKRACTVRHDMWSGWRLGERIGAVWGNPESQQHWRLWLRNLLLQRMTFLDTLRMDEEAMRTFHSKLLREKPIALFGHAHSLYLFAAFMKANSLDGIYPRGIISTAMVLHDFERATIEEVFGCKVTNRYGCEEVSLIACECEAHSGLHVNMDTLIVECVDGDGCPVPQGESGAVVVTDLSNMGMPIIRYRVGDVSRFLTEPCSCGRSYPRLAAVEGRIADYVRTPEGEFISGISLTENFAMKLTGVKQLQIVQEELDHLLFRIVRGEDWQPESEKVLGGLVQERFGGSMRFDMEFTDSIQSETSGKFRFCISKLADKPFSPRG
ncbi:phenylacetate--CoA ligase family protein [Oleidesulfovibrio sp.]|uniref:phenylacetate--CoA ligase family protein n=1 Tax=Oleidesulfovibrio sp. TaxID=2909707 RepID=UPI003A8C1646